MFFTTGIPDVPRARVAGLTAVFSCAPPLPVKRKTNDVYSRSMPYTACRPYFKTGARVILYVYTCDFTKSVRMCRSWRAVAELRRVRFYHFRRALKLLACYPCTALESIIVHQAIIHIIMIVPMYTCTCHLLVFYLVQLDFQFHGDTLLVRSGETRTAKVS